MLSSRRNDDGNERRRIDRHGESSHRTSEHVGLRDARARRSSSLDVRGASLAIRSRRATRRARASRPRSRRRAKQQERQEDGCRTHALLPSEESPRGVEAGQFGSSTMVEFEAEESRSTEDRVPSQVLLNFLRMYIFN